MGGGMSAEQRWAARGVVVVLALLWAALGGWAVVEGLRIRSDDMTGAGVAAAGLLVVVVSTLWLAVGLVTVARAESRRWRWRTVAFVLGVAAVASGYGTAQARDDLLAALLAFQAVALVGYAVLLRVPPPPEVADGNAA